MKKLGLLVCSCVALSSCVVVHDHGDDATLTVAWTIDGRADRARCRQGDVDTADILIETASGRRVDEFQAPCNAFEASIGLEVGTYFVSVVLVDPDGNDRTTAVDSDPVVLHYGDDVVVDVDFPADSFF